MFLSTTSVRLLHMRAGNWQPCCPELWYLCGPAGTYYRSLQTSMIDLENLFDLFANSPQIQVGPVVSKDASFVWQTQCSTLLHHD